MPNEICNCENSKCDWCNGKGCSITAGRKRALYIGAICNECATYMPTEYMLPDKEEE